MQLRVKVEIDVIARWKTVDDRRSEHRFLTTPGSPNVSVRFSVYDSRTIDPAATKQQQYYYVPLTTVIYQRAIIGTGKRKPPDAHDVRTIAVTRSYEYFCRIFLRTITVIIGAINHVSEIRTEIENRFVVLITRRRLEFVRETASAFVRHPRKLLFECYAARSRKIGIYKHVETRGYVSIVVETRICSEI